MRNPEPADERYMAAQGALYPAEPGLSSPVSLLAQLLWSVGVSLRCSSTLNGVKCPTVFTRAYRPVLLVSVHAFVRQLVTLFVAYPWACFLSLPTGPTACYRA